MLTARKIYVVRQSEEFVFCARPVEANVPNLI